MVTTTPARRKRCQLCLAILELETISGGGEVSRISFEERHTTEECARATHQRIVVLEEIHQRDARELETQSQIIDDLGQWVGLATKILDAGEKWIAHRDKRAEDIARLRQAFQTGDRSSRHPLWQSEEELATEVRNALDRVNRSARSA